MSSEIEIILRKVPRASEVVIGIDGDSTDQGVLGSLADSEDGVRSLDITRLQQPVFVSFSGSSQKAVGDGAGSRTALVT